MVANNLGHDEIQKFFSENRIKTSFICQGAQALNLGGFTRLIRRWQVVFRFQHTDLLGQLEALGQCMQQHSIEIINAGAQTQKFIHGRGHHLLLLAPRQTGKTARKARQAA